MHISQFHIRNFKSFWDSNAGELGPGFNVIMGPNNSGKTAIVESLTTVIGLYPILSNLPPEIYTEHLKTFASLYSGVVGLIIGFYFGKPSS